jgi:hypothetical protein
MAVTQVRVAKATLVDAPPAEPRAAAVPASERRAPVELIVVAVVCLVQLAWVGALAYAAGRFLL